MTRAQELVQENLDFLTHYFKEEPDLQSQNWLTWLKQIKVYNEPVRFKTLIHELNSAAEFLNPLKNTYYARRMLTKFMFLREKNDTSFVDTNDRYIYMKDYLSEKASDRRLIPNVTPEQYYDFVFFHELAHIMWYDFFENEESATQAKAVFVNIGMASLMRHMSENVDTFNVKDKKFLSELRTNTHESFCDTVSLYLLSKKYDLALTGDDVGIPYNLGMYRRENAWDIKTHDTKDVVHHALKEKIYNEESFSAFVSRVYSVSLKYTYEKFLKELKTSQTLQNLALRTINQDYAFFSEHVKEEKSAYGINAAAFCQIWGAVESKKMLFTNYNRMKCREVLDKLVAEVFEDLRLLRQSHEIDRPYQAAFTPGKRNLGN